MQDDKLTGALEVLLEQLNSQIREVSETKRTINGLLRRMGEAPRFPEENDAADNGILPLRSDQFYGKPLATAVQMYLERRKQACGVDEILKALEQGGFDFRSLSWGENERLRILAISLAKNNAVFHKLPNGTIGLRSWYDETILKRSEKSVSATAKRKGSRGKANKRKAPRQIEASRETLDTETTTPPAVTGRVSGGKSKAGGQGD